MTGETYPLDLGFLDLTCEKCGVGDCPLWEGERPGEWLCDPCKDAVHGGDAIGRVMESEGVGFIEAVGRVAKSRGLPLERRTTRDTMKLDHLTDADHIEAARLLNEVQDRLAVLSRIIKRAPWTDQVMRVQKAVQERLIDPLSEARISSRERSFQPPERENIYPSVYYSIRR